MRPGIRRWQWTALIATALALAVNAPSFMAFAQGGIRISQIVVDEVHWNVTGPTSVTVHWRGDGNILLYGITTAYGEVAVGASPSPLPFSSAGPFREAKITGLQPETTYHYSVEGGADHTFRTASLPGTQFVVAAEADIGDSTSYDNMPLVQALIAGIRPDLVLVSGDLTYGDSHGQQTVDQHFNDVMVWSRDAAYMPAWGNHEWESKTDDLRNYKGRFDFANPQTSPGSPAVSCCGEDWHWFDYGNTRFIAYPEPWSGAWSDWYTKVTALMDQAQADENIAFIVTYGHRPAYSSGHHPGSTTLKGYLDTLGSTHTKYVLNLNAHSHNYERTYPQSGVVHITVGTGGAGLEQDGSCLWLMCTQPSWSAARYMRHGVTKLTFTSTGILGEFVCGPPGGGINDIDCTSGDVIDAFTIGAVSVDTTPPTVSITDPLNGAEVSGTITVRAAASDNVGVTRVEFLVDGVLQISDAVAPYEFAWNTASVSNGTHALGARAYDGAGNVGTASTVSVTVNNVDTTPPTVSITEPANGATVRGVVMVRASATDNVGVVRVDFLVDGALKSSDATVPYEFAWDTLAVPDGGHALTAKAVDAAGNSATSPPVTAYVSNGVLTFFPTEDATIKAAFPTANYGRSGKLEADNSPSEHFLLKFVVSGLTGRQITSATLRLYCINDSDKGGDFHRVADNTWGEQTVTWMTAPAADPALIASLGRVANNTWYEVDLTALVIGDGTYSLRVTSASSDGADYVSKDSSRTALRPYLIVTATAPSAAVGSLRPLAGFGGVVRVELSRWAREWWARR